MNGSDWWWIVYDMQLPGEPSVQEDREHGAICRGGANARKKAEDQAKLYLERLDLI